MIGGKLFFIQAAVTGRARVRLPPFPLSLKQPSSRPAGLQTTQAHAGGSGTQPCIKLRGSSVAPTTFPDGPLARISYRQEPAMSHAIREPMRTFVPPPPARRGAPGQHRLRRRLRAQRHPLRRRLSRHAQFRGHRPRAGAGPGPITVGWSVNEATAAAVGHGHSLAGRTAWSP